jgi:hypothetical protein
MSRFIFAFVLLMFSINTASASGLLGCCDMSGQKVQIEAKATSSMPHCHEMGEKADHKEAPNKANHCLCASMCAAKIANSVTTPEFKAISFDIPASHGDHDIGLSIDRRPSTPPPKI